jgi:predicted small metal-binding protein
MARELRCADLIPGCDFVVQATRDSEVMKKAAEHAKRAHRMVAIAMEVEKKARAAIRDVSTLRQESRMLENRTRLLLILSQDMLDQARVIAGAERRQRSSCQ